MSDFALVPISSLGIEGDLVVDGQLYQETSGLETAIRLSLFTDARAEEGDDLPDVLEFGSDRRGWWGDAFLDDSNGSIGSRLWTLSRSALTSETRQRARDFALEALSWLTELGIASEVNVDAQIAARGRLEIFVEVFRESDPPARFAFLWGEL